MKNTRKSGDLPIKKNDEITLTIDALGSEGQGIGRYEGVAVFVPNALPGETVRVHIIKVEKRYAVARLMGIIEPSPDRVTPVCGSFYACGGCALQHMTYPAQLDFKRTQVKDALQRLGGLELDDSKIAPTLGMKEPVHYRNKTGFPMGIIDGMVSVGMFAKRSHRLVPVDTCVIQSKQALSVMETVTNWARKYSITTYDETEHTGVLRHLVVRTTAGGAVVVTVVTNGALPRKDELIDALRADIPGLSGVVHNINTRRSNVILGEEFKTLWGDDCVEEEILGLRFRVSPQSFMQVNYVQTEVLYKKALDYLELTGKERVLDIYCGIGTITLLLAKSAGEVIGIESVPQAIEDARFNAEMNGIVNAEFIVSEAEKALPQMIADGMRPDAIVIDPPRKGCEEPVLKAIAESGVEKLVYISCNPATLARDVKILAGYGFVLNEATPVDMFPLSSHVETVVSLSHQNPNKDIQ